MARNQLIITTPSQVLSYIHSGLLRILLMSLSVVLFNTGCSSKNTTRNVNAEDNEVQNFDNSSIDLELDSFAHKVILINSDTGQVASESAELTIQILGHGGSCILLEETQKNVRPEPVTGEVVLTIGKAVNRTEGDKGLSVKGVFASYSQLSTDTKFLIPGAIFDASSYSSSCQAEMVAMGSRRLRISVLDGDTIFTVADEIIHSIGTTQTGSTGASGETGATGSTGANGIDGQAGEQGVPGPKGDPGEKGADGVTPSFLRKNCRWAPVVVSVSNCSFGARYAPSTGTSECNVGEYVAGTRVVNKSCSGVVNGSSFTSIITHIESKCCQP